MNFVVSPALGGGDNIRFEIAISGFYGLIGVVITA